jgi:hypothetical protein
MSVLSEPQYPSEEAASAFVEAHVWRDGRVCRVSRAELRPVGP